MSDARTDVLIVGAGPVGLFAAFQLGLFGFKSHIVDALDRAGGQCIEYYADKPIYDVPAYSAITGQQLVDKLLEQAAPFEPRFSFNTVARALAASDDGTYRVELSNGGTATASTVIIAAGWGIIGQRSADDSNPISGWGVGLSDNVVPVDTEKYQSALPGVYAIGDMCFYPGKLRLILSGFHEAALATQAIRKRIAPRTCSPGQYTSAVRGSKKKLRPTGPE